MDGPRRPLFRDHDLEGAVTVGARAGEAMRAVFVDRPMPWVEIGGGGIAIDLLPAAAAWRITWPRWGTCGWGTCRRARSRKPDGLRSPHRGSRRAASAWPTWPWPPPCRPRSCAATTSLRSRSSSVCHGAGMRVPDDLTVIGFGDRPFAAVGRAGAHHGSAPARPHLARRAADRLLALRAGPSRRRLACRQAGRSRRSSGGLVSRGTQVAGPRFT